MHASTKAKHRKDKQKKEEEKHKKWSMKMEREHEARNPGPQEERKEGAKETKLIVEIINVTSANSNRQTILKRKSHIQCMSETCLTKAQRETLQKEARSIGKAFQGGPTDPEQGKAAAGVGFLSLEGLNLYPVAKPIKDYCDAEATGRCRLYASTWQVLPVPSLSSMDGQGQ